jgi:Tol biopolymer transport system component
MREDVAANGRSQMPAISPDGRFVVFTAHATDLTMGDDNGASDVFARDRVTGTTRLVSLNSAGEQGDADSFGPSISADGRFVAFTSEASNLVPGATGHQFRVYVRDLELGMTELVSADAAGMPGDGMSFRAAISADGGTVAFSSAAQLTPGGLPGVWAAYVRDRVKGVTERISVSTDGASANGPCKGSAVSADGRFVAFTSSASNLVPEAGARGDGVYLRDRQSGVTERISVSDDGKPADAPAIGWSMSADGRFVAFGSAASNLVPGDPRGVVNIYLRDRQSGVTERISVADGGGPADAACHFIPLVSGDGRFVAFATRASNLAPGGATGRWDMFVRDRVKGVTERLMTAPDGATANGETATDSVGAGISADGRFVVVTSAASNLVSGSVAGTAEVLVRDRDRGVTERAAPRNAAVPVRTATGTDAGSDDLPAAYVAVVASQEHGAVVTASPDLTDKTPYLRRAAEPLSDGGDAAMLSNNRWIHPSRAEPVAGVGDGTGAITAYGSAFLEVPFFARDHASFRHTSSTVAWHGASPFNADKVIHTDHWRVQAYPGGVTVRNAPPGANVDTQGEVHWQTELTDAWISRHTWDEVEFVARGIVYRSYYGVTGTFQFGSTFFVVEDELSACT